MSQVAGTRWAVALVTALGGLAGSATAQLTGQDLEQLRIRAAAEGWTFTIAENEATQRPLSELCGLRVPPNWRDRAPFDDTPARGGLPTAFDWRDVGGQCFVPPVRNQGNCGSCWAFPPLAALESAIMRHDGVADIDLSEMWLIACTNAGNCYNGGWHQDVFEYLRCNGWTDYCGGNGAVLDADCPYNLPPAACGCPFNHPYCIDGWAVVGPKWGEPTAAQIKQAVYDHGPVAVGLLVDGAIQAYGGGVFNACNPGSWVNHVVTIVGWDDSQGTSGVWFVRNSWGPNWGEGGYMRIEYDCSNIGFAACYLDYCCADCNANGVRDAQDITTGTSLDCNANNVPDECELAADCNANGVPDDCDLQWPLPVVRNDLAAVLGWVEISATGRPMNLADDGVRGIAMPFRTSLFHGGSVMISNNGALSPGGPPELLSNNEPMPTTNAFGGEHAFVPYWDDLAATTGNVYWQVLGAAPTRTFIVEWYNRPHFPGDTILDGDEVTFQVQVFEQPVNGVLAQYLYLDTVFLDFELDDGGSATVGYQRDGFHGQQWSFNSMGWVYSGAVLSVHVPGTPASADANCNGVPDECDRCAGDANCDGGVSWRDIDFFIAAQDDDAAAWWALFAPDTPPCPFSNCDVNGDGTVNWRDVDPFVAAMNTSCP